MTVQLENGYTKIANEILEQIAKVKLNGTQFRIVMTVLRYTYGFNRKEHAMSVNFISQATGLNKRQVQRELSILIDESIIIVKKEATFSSAAVLGFNKHFDDWGSNSNQVTNKTPGSEKDTQTGDGLDTGGGVGLDTGGGVGLDTQEIKLKKNIKENSKEKYCREIFDHWNQQKIIVHQELTLELNKAIDKAFKKYPADLIVLSISHYSSIYHDQNYYFNYKWTLGKFLSQKNCIPDFLDDGEKWINYQADINSRASPSNTKPAAAADKNDLVDQYFRTG